MNINRSLPDARQKLNQKVRAARDARFKLTQAALKTKTALANKPAPFDARSKLIQNKTVIKKFDARAKIKRSSPPRLAGTKTINKTKELKKNVIKITMGNAEKTNVANRTIRNPSAISVTKKQNMPDFSKQKPTGFISVTNGSRVLMDKVTVQPMGLKIVVRNDEALKTKQPMKKTQNTDQQERKGLRITMANPDAIKKQQPPPRRRPKQPAPTKQSTLRSNLLANRIIPRKRAYTRPLYPPATHIAPPPQRQPAALQPHEILEHDLLGYGHVDHNPAHPMLLKRQRLAQPHHALRPMISPKTRNMPPRMMVTPTTFPLDLEHDEVHDISSPFEGTKILVSNLHPVVVEEDIVELFSVLGPVRRARLIGPGKAEVVFIRRDDAIRAYQKYNNRDLDGQPMRMKLLLQERTPQNLKYTWMSEIRAQPKKGSEIIEIEPNVLQRALFKGGSTGTSTRPVVFTVKI